MRRYDGNEGQLREADLNGIRELKSAEQGALDGLKVTVFGRGPIGLMTAFSLAQNGAMVQVLAASPLSAGVGFFVAAGLIEPVATKDPRARRWMEETLAFFQWAAGDARWGVIPRRVLFLSDDVDATKQDWMESLGRRDASSSDLRGGREHGCWFESVVVQPDLAMEAIKRETGNLDVIGAAKDMPLGGPVTIGSIEDAADRALAQRSDVFVVATGMGIAGLGDIEQLTGMPTAAGMSAGLGAVLRIPAECFVPRLDYVMMDDDTLSYLIPQRTHVIAGGTNHLAEHDDPAVKPGPHPALLHEWEAEVREKIDRLVPGAGDLPGEIRCGARPMRSEVLTHWTEGFSVPGLILGGAGGSGWTFSVGIAHDACRVVADRFGRTDALLALGPGAPHTTGSLGAPA
jgi:glycine/D-amino acid oxidase-like deaminating enzyme